MRLAHPTCLILAAAVVLPAHASSLPVPNRVTILYDAFGAAPAHADWGFAQRSSSTTGSGSCSTPATTRMSSPRMSAP